MDLIPLLSKHTYLSSSSELKVSRLTFSSEEDVRWRRNVSII